MVTLLVIIYLAFIGLGLPDSLLGAAWPVMQLDIHAPLSSAGVVSTIVFCGTVVSSLSSTRIIRRYKTGPVTLISVLMTALALLLISRATNVTALCLLALPLGLGAGSVDAGLNNFVALHYKAKHMNWLHCFWGIGATAGPMVMALFLSSDRGWQHGYLTIALVQFVLVVILASSLPLWKKALTQDESEHSEPLPLATNWQAFKMPGVKHALLAFFCYCGCEVGAGLWAASYLVAQKGLTSATAALWVSLYYGSITVGRLVSGFVTIKISTQQLIRTGCVLGLLGAVILLLPLPAIFSLVGFILIGFGGAPFFPGMLHETPVRFGKAVSQAAMGLQMASAYIGSMLVPLLIGFLSKWFTLSFLPWFLLVLIAGMLLFNERIAHAIRKKG